MVNVGRPQVDLGDDTRLLGRLAHGSPRPPLSDGSGTEAALSPKMRQDSGQRGSLEKSVVQRVKIGLSAHMILLVLGRRDN